MIEKKRLGNAGPSVGRLGYGAMVLEGYYGPSDDDTGIGTIRRARLTGARQKIGNYPGVTVERKSGLWEFGARRVELVDLPGAYSLAAPSPDELVAFDFLTGHLAGEPAPDVVICVVDASNLVRNLFRAGGCCGKCPATRPGAVRS